MDKIYKFELPKVACKFTLTLPKEAQVISCAVQRETPVIWVVFETGNELKLEKREYLLITTGEEFDNPFMWHGTFLLGGGDYVLHLFEL